MNRWLLVGLLLGGIAGAAPATVPVVVQASRSAPQSQDAPLLRRAQQLTQAFYALRVQEVWAAFTPELQAIWGGVDAFRAYREAGLREYGAETEVLDERVVAQDGLRYYVRAAVFARHPSETWLVVLGFDAEEHVQVFSITLAGDPAGPPAEEPLRTRLPGARTAA